MKCADAKEAFSEYTQMAMGSPSKKAKHQPGMLILILDELDQLRSQDSGILYSLFGLPQVSFSCLAHASLSSQIPKYDASS